MPPKNPSQNWPSVKAPKALAASLRIGWRIKRQGGTSHRILERPGCPDILSGKRIVKLNFGKRDDPVLPTLRRVLRDARAVARKGGITGRVRLPLAK